MAEKTLFDKIWDQHVITGEEGDQQLLYIDQHMIHEVTSPQGFEYLRSNDWPVRRPDKHIATLDHNVPTQDVFNITDPISKIQVETMRDNCDYFGIHLNDVATEYQGIVHMIGPELGASQPGKTIVCGDSHTATHGAFGAIAFGIGSSEVQHVLATQCLWQVKPKRLGVKITGKLPEGLYAKDIMLKLISTYGADYGIGHAVEYFGEAISDLSMEGRMTICNMSIEFGSKMGLMPVDETTLNWLKGRPFAPSEDQWDDMLEYWDSLKADEDAVYDRYIELDVSDLKPQVTWGTNPGMGVDVDQALPEADSSEDERAYEYMGLEAGMMPDQIELDHVFIGSCTNSRLSDLIEAAKILKGHKIHDSLSGIVVPGSQQVKRAAEEIGLDQIFIDAGLEWREPGCSACLGMNEDSFPEFSHVISTSNRNYENRMGKNARAHLASPATVAASAIAGHIVDSRDFERAEIEVPNGKA